MDEISILIHFDDVPPFRENVTCIIIHSTHLFNAKRILKRVTQAERNSMVMNRNRIERNDRRSSDQFI